MVRQFLKQNSVVNSIESLCMVPINNIHQTITI